VYKPRKKAAMKSKIFSTPLILTLIILFGISGALSAQSVNSLYFLEQTPTHTQWNPAMAPDRSYIGFGASSMAFSVQSDLAFSDIFIPSETTGKLNLFLNSEVDRTEWVNGLKDVSNINAGIDLDFFRLGLNMGKNYISLNAGLHADLGVGLPKDFFKLFVLGMDTEESSTEFNLTDMNVNILTYAKIGAGLTRRFGNFTLGVNVNYLRGIADMRMGFDELTVDASETSWNVTSKGYVKLAAPDQIDFKYNEEGYLSGINANTSTIIDQIKTLPDCGSGFSFDLGMTAQVMNFITLSAAVTDIGSIKWKKEAVKCARSDGSFDWEGTEIKEGDDGSDIMDDFNDMIHFEKDENAGAYTSKLTTKINLGAEAALLNNHLSFGLLSQTGLAENGRYQDFMGAVNLKPTKSFQTALTYSMLHGEMSSFGAAVNIKLLILDLFLAADYIPLKVTPQGIPVNNSYFNMQTGFNLVF
jgi:hypothetical protein